MRQTTPVQAGAQPAWHVLCDEQVERHFPAQILFGKHAETDLTK